MQPIKDHNGKVFKNPKALAKHYKIPYNRLMKRLYRKWTIKDAIFGKEPLIDHLGNKFTTINQAAKFHNISQTTLAYRIRVKNMSFSDALQSMHKPKDHLGNHYKNIRELCDTYNIPISLYYQRLKQGLDLEQILTKPLYQNRETKDHLGNVFKNQTEMCEYYNITYTTFKSRLQKDWSLENALTTPAIKYTKRLPATITDHLGNNFKTLKAVSDYHKISYEKLRNRIRIGWSMEKAITKP